VTAPRLTPGCPCPTCGHPLRGTRYADRHGRHAHWCGWCGTLTGICNAAVPPDCSQPDDFDPPVVQVTEAPEYARANAPRAALEARLAALGFPPLKAPPPPPHPCG